MSWDQLVAFAQSTPLLSLAFVGLTVAIIVTQIRHRFSGFAAVSPIQATRLMNQDDALVVDVSPTADFGKAHILSAVSVPLSEFDPAKHKVLSKAQERPVIIVCRTGNTATDAAKRLLKAGYKNVSVLDGGLAAWRAADLPVVKSR